MNEELLPISGLTEVNKGNRLSEEVGLVDIFTKVQQALDISNETTQLEDEKFQQRTLIRYKADFDDPDELVKLEAIPLVSMNQDEYLRMLIEMSWFPCRPKIMNKETITKTLLKHLDNIHDWSDLRQVEISIITLQS
ncbi:unnamed protein product [Schistosoma turkestanicum]|nr:unnamed protein product [Schistosoma turkestanicum]